MHKTPLNVWLVWHPSADEQCQPLVKACFKALNRDERRPFSRGLRIPVYYRCANAPGEKRPAPLDLDAAERNIAIALVDDNFVCDDEWAAYLSDLNTKLGAAQGGVLQIAMLSRNASSCVPGTINGFRLYDKPDDQKVMSWLCFVMHELCRFLKGAKELTERGKRLADRPVQIFLSHAKADEKAVSLVEAVMRSIDSSPVGRFVDMHDIPPGSDFAEEIRGRIGESVLAAFRSDSYCSRPWCQQEVLEAKRQDCPIVIVDVLETDEDRAFPHLGNVPVLHIGSFSPDADHNDLSQLVARITAAALREHLRFTYSGLYLDSLRGDGAIPPDATILRRPPEPRDALSGSVPKTGIVVYPDPPLEDAELAELEHDGLTFETPLTAQRGDVSDLVVGLSLSEPNKESLAERGLGAEHVAMAVQELTLHLMNRGVALCYGGDLRKGGYTEFVCEKARCSQRMVGDTFVRLRNYLAWPIHLALDIAWAADRADVAEMRKVSPPPELAKAGWISEDEPISAKSDRGRLIWDACLRRMRTEMIEGCDARVSLGGRLFGYSGMMPGVLQEALISIRTDTPLYLLGGFGGATQAISQALSGMKPDALTDAAQRGSSQNTWLKEAMSLHRSNAELFGSPVDYASLCVELASYGPAALSSKNGLTEAQNSRLAVSTNLDEVVNLVVEGLAKVKSSLGRSSSESS